MPEIEPATLWLLFIEADHSASIIQINHDELKFEISDIILYTIAILYILGNAHKRKSNAEGDIENQISDNNQITYKQVL